MKKILSIILLTVFVFTVSINTYAARSTVYLPKNQKWSKTYATTRTGKVGYVTVNCYAVYPPNGGTDNFEKVQFVVRNSKDQNIMSIQTVSEKWGKQTFYIKEGYYDATKIKFYFRGNNPKYEAETDIYYSGN